MKKERSFRPPQSVLDSVSQLDCSSAAIKLNQGPIPLSDLRVMHSILRVENVMAKVDQWRQQGGNEGLRWARRILHQQGVLKFSRNGDASIPAIIDLQLGPQIIAAFSSKPVDELAKKFEEAGIPASLVEIDGGTLSFFSNKIDEVVKTCDGVPHIPEISVEDLVIIEEGRDRVETIHKIAGDTLVGVKCEALTDLPSISGISFDDAYLLKSSDYEEGHAKVIKVDTSLGLVMGWAIICKIADQPYFDTQGDHIPEPAMLEASVDFMANSRMSPEMHQGESKGTVLFAWPMTREIAESFGITTAQTGLMIAMKPNDPAILEKFQDGTYTGFSIGGSRIPEFTEEVDNA